MLIEQPSEEKSRTLQNKNRESNIGNTCLRDSRRFSQLLKTFQRGNFTKVAALRVQFQQFGLFRSPYN